MWICKWPINWIRSGFFEGNIWLVLFISPIVKNASEEILFIIIIQNKAPKSMKLTIQMRKIHWTKLEGKLDNRHLLTILVILISFSVCLFVYLYNTDRWPTPMILIRKRSKPKMHQMKLLRNKINRRPQMNRNHRKIHHKSWFHRKTVRMHRWQMMLNR